MVTDALRQALQIRRRGAHAWVAAGLIHHSDAGSQYGFKWSLQHLDRGGADGATVRVDDDGDGAAGDALTGTAASSA
jgi:putative transposase